MRSRTPPPSICRPDVNHIEGPRVSTGIGAESQMRNIPDARCHFNAPHGMGGLAAARRVMLGARLCHVGWHAIASHILLYQSPQQLLSPLSMSCTASRQLEVLEPSGVELQVSDSTCSLFPLFP